MPNKNNQLNRKISWAKVLLSGKKSLGAFLVMILAIVAFGISRLAPIYKADLPISVELKNIPKGLIYAGPPIHDLECRVRGSKAIIDSLKAKKLICELDLSHVAKGLVSIEVKRNDLPFPGSIKLINIHPSSLSLKIEEQLIKRLDLSPVLTGEPAVGHVIAGTKLEPSYIVVKGPYRILHSLDHLLTKPVDIGGKSESFEKEAAIDLVEGLRLVSGGKLINLKVSIKEKIGEKKIKGIMVKVEGGNRGFTITPPCLDIEVRGPVGSLDKLKPEKDIKTLLDIKGLKQGRHLLSVNISLPVNLTLVKVYPLEFEVNIFKKKK